MLGLYNITDDVGYNHLFYNSKTVHKSGHSFMNSYGIRTDDDILLMDNSLIAESIYPSNIHDEESQLDFGKAKLIAHESTIDIALDDFRVLLEGKTVGGHTVYNPDVNYNIITKELTENTETSATFTKEECPTLMLKHFNARIKAGNTLSILYYVDTYHMNRFRYDKLEDTFTIVVIDKDNNVIAKQTQYAGDGIIQIGPLNKLGKNWCEIKAIDSDGCASPSIFIDYYVEAKTNPNLLQITTEMLEEYHITEGKTSYDPTDNIDAYGNSVVDNAELLERAAFRNKLGFTALFDKAKSLGYGGVKFPKIVENGVTRNAYFNISYNKNNYVNTETVTDAATASNIMGKLDLDTVKFFKVKVRQESNEVYIYTDVVQVDWNTYLNECKQYLWTNWDESKFVIYSGSGDGRLYDDCYVISDLNDLVQAIANHDITSVLTDACRIKRPQKTSNWPIVGEQYVKHTVYKSSGAVKYEYFNPNDKASNGWYYLTLVRDCVNRNKNSITWPEDSTMKIPSNFVIDLNCTTFHGLDVTNHVTNTRIIGIYNQSNIKIMNGKIEGRYKDMKDNIVIYQTSRFSVPTLPYTKEAKPFKLSDDIAPGCATIETYGLDNGVFENLETSQAVGYDNTMSAAGGTKCGVLMVNYTESAITSAMNTLRNELSKTTLSKDLFTDFPYDSFYGENTRTMSISKMCTLVDKYGHVLLKTGVILLDEIDSNGYGTGFDRPHYGTRQHYIVLCYNNDNKLIRLFKIFRGCHVTFPNEVTKIKYIVYGKSGAFNNDVYPDGPNWPTGPTYEALVPATNITFNHCYMHHTKTNVCHTEFARNCGFINCTFSRTGLGLDELYWGSKTALFTNFEEGGESIERAFFVNCHHYGKIMDEDGVDGSNTIGFHGANQFYMNGCTSFGLMPLDRVRCAIIENCHLDRYQMGICKDSPTAFIIIRNSIIEAPTQDYSRNNSNYGTQGFAKGWPSRHVPPADIIVTMTDTILNSRFKYCYFHFHRVRNGKQIFD